MKDLFEFLTVVYLHDAEELDCVVLAVVEDLVAEHCAHGVVTDVVRHSDSPPANNPFYSLQFTVFTQEFTVD